MISYTDSDGSYWAMIAGDGGPTVLHHGERSEPPYPEVAWDKALREKGLPHAGFSCNRCGSLVVAIHRTTQICRCARVMHEPGHQFRSGEQWEEWQDDYDRQLKDPAPKDYWIDTGQIPKAVCLKGKNRS